jgi:mRNA interferase MazF
VAHPTSLGDCPGDWGTNGSPPFIRQDLRGGIYARLPKSARAPTGSCDAMTVVSHPMPGTIVRVDLSDGFRVPEIGKRRPAIILSPPIPGRPQMCTIVPLSTTPPKPVLRHHMEIRFDPPLPHPYEKPSMWVKGDIVLTVAFHRLRLLFSCWSGGQRIYDIRVIDPVIFARVQECVRCGLGL